MRGILLICLRRLGRDLKLADGSNEDKVATGMPRSVMTIRSLPAARLTQRPVSRWSSRMLIFFMCTLCHKAVCSFKLAARVRSYESLCALRARQEIRCTFCCWPAGRSPEGRGGGRASAALPLLDDATTLPASRRLASARPALAPKCTPYFLTGPNLGHGRDGHATKRRSLAL